jgi:hypothetical protein
MGSGVVVRPDQVSLGVLVAAVPRDVIDVPVGACGLPPGDRVGLEYTIVALTCHLS